MIRLPEYSCYILLDPKVIGINLFLAIIASLSHPTYGHTWAQKVEHWLGTEKRTWKGKITWTCTWSDMDIQSIINYQDYG